MRLWELFRNLDEQSLGAIKRELSQPTNSVMAEKSLLDKVLVPVKKPTG